MEYNQITEFLEKFKKILFKKEEIYKIISQTIFKYTHFELEPKFISIKNAIIYIDTTPIVKSEIFVYKNKILFDLKKEIPENNFSDIR